MSKPDNFLIINYITVKLIPNQGIHPKSTPKGGKIKSEVKAKIWQAI